MFSELKLTIQPKVSVHYLQAQERIAKWLNQAQLADPSFKQSHYERSFKHYVFNNLYPTEADGIYQQGRVYVLTVRSSVADILNRLRRCLQACREDEHFYMIACEQQTRRLGLITELLTISPAIVTLDEQRPWMPEDSIALLLERLHANAEKKFKSLFPASSETGFQSFIQSITVENSKPIATAYKGRKLLGNKFHIMVNEDKYSQQLANVVLGSGLAEKNSSIGAGFCLAKYIRY